MRYRISEAPLRLKAYGRNIQSMVDYAKQIENREDRTRIAYEIVRIMSNLNPSIRDTPDYEQKLWDHLFMVSEFTLDVDSPFPMPDPEELERLKSKRLKYSKNPPRFRQYGVNTQLMIKKAVEMPDGPQKKAYINIIANTMKQFLTNTNRDNAPEDVLALHIEEISKGQLKVNADELVFHKFQPNKNQGRQIENGQSSSTYKKNRKNRGSGRKNRRRK